MPSYLRNEVVLVRYPFTSLTGSKVRPAVVMNAPHVSQDVLIVPLTSKTTSLLPGEFVLSDWAASGLNVASAVKRGIFTVHQSLVIKRVGTLRPPDAAQVESALRDWLGL